MKKGKLLKSTKSWWQTLYEGVCRTFPRRHESKEKWDEAWFYVSNYMNERREYYQQLEDLPKRFGKKYTEDEYKKDIENVVDYYTKWNREDFWQSKKSLKRIRQYEKREGLEPFEVIKEREVSLAIEERLKQKDLEYYYASKNQTSLV